MALVECPDCKKHISYQAPACPNCGRPNHIDTDSREEVHEGTQKTERKKDLGHLVALLGIIASVFCGIAFANGQIFLWGMVASALAGVIIQYR